MPRADHNDFDANGSTTTTRRVGCAGSWQVISRIATRRPLEGTLYPPYNLLIRPLDLPSRTPVALIFLPLDRPALLFAMRRVPTLKFGANAQNPATAPAYWLSGIWRCSALSRGGFPQPFSLRSSGSCGSNHHSTRLKNIALTHITLRTIPGGRHTSTPSYKPRAGSRSSQTLPTSPLFRNVSLKCTTTRASQPAFGRSNIYGASPAKRGSSLHPRMCLALS
ncbi:hypothetical protein DFP72DRAFT_500561 [Ephemerocybe angulata]|uniref:Uncharacterized protein n=1 Tax=Ephemerocybe angulata TaxID=980116 RepID=A0A8H6HR25_9AGAR|nr:hypothetical protein DFP72DRAFT_500561 [Tulosesus angulatus]